MAYNPVVTSDGTRWRDYELAADLPSRPPIPPEGPPTPFSPPDPTWHDRPLHHGPDTTPPDWTVSRGPDTIPPDWTLLPSPNKTPPDWFDRPDRPARLDTCRVYGVPGGFAWPDPQLQQDLCQAVADGVRFPDPRGTWLRLINGEGPGEDPFRAANALDCALAVISTWHGEPVVAAPRRPEYDRVGRPSLQGEPGGVGRAERWLGHTFEYIGQGRRAYTLVSRRVHAAGHGAAAVLITRWPSGGSHAFTALNAAGEVVWADGQRAHTSLEPPTGPVAGVFCVILDRSGHRR
ncbi:hypothetical protein GCM10009677_10550 [Sphaerisporangium rubeum]|uniref:Tox-PL domain-containing protein n=1 Tax=Sphaerisporangium rubeum TaxID=321317 RepID=A0A7X0M556_9ACTN|nr:hypothetical protein [Sphaerisporangium rubeum]